MKIILLSGGSGINEMDIPVIVIGMHNTVVSSSPDGILVTEKAASTLALFGRRMIFQNMSLNVLVPAKRR